MRMRLTDLIYSNIFSILFHFLLVELIKLLLFLLLLFSAICCLFFASDPPYSAFSLLLCIDKLFLAFLPPCFQLKLYLSLSGLGHV